MRINNRFVHVVGSDFARLFSRNKAEELKVEFLRDPDVHEVSIEPIIKDKCMVIITLKSKPKYIWVVT